MCIKRINALKIILAISVAGILFSGYLSFLELSTDACSFGNCQYLFGLPVCIYGLAMYLIISVISLLGLKSRK